MTMATTGEYLHPKQRMLSRQARTEARASEAPRDSYRSPLSMHLTSDCGKCYSHS
jgi:hypothetical protein